MKFRIPFIYCALALSPVSYSATVQHQGFIDISTVDPKLIIAGQERIRRQAVLLKAHLPLQIEALQEAQNPYQSIIDAQRILNPLEAFKAASAVAGMRWIIGVIEDLLKCMRDPNPAVVGIGVGASPAIKQYIDQYIGYLDAAKTDCARLKALAPDLQDIIKDIPNAELPTYE